MSAERARVAPSCFDGSYLSKGAGTIWMTFRYFAYALFGAPPLIFTRPQTDMVYVLTKKTTKRQFDALLKRTARRSPKRKGVDFSDLVGTAPLHDDPVKFFRALRDEK